MSAVVDDISTASAEVGIGSRARTLDWLTYWGGIPVQWSRQAVRNGHDILRVLDVLRWRPLGPGLVDVDHPWVTGLNPATGREIWPDNVIYRSPRSETADCAEDETVLYATGKFMAARVRQSAILPELPLGPKRRMPHAVNYMHGSSHYNSGLILLNDLADGFRHLSDFRFRRDLHDFVRRERREVLFLFRCRDYDPREYAYLSCCMRTYFHWFCNPNGPQAKVLWGNFAPFPAANLITGHWADDLYALKYPGGAADVIRPAIEPDRYLQRGPYFGTRSAATWAEKLLAKGNDLRIRARGVKGGMFFIDRREIYRDQIASREQRGLNQDDRAQI